MVNPLYWGIYKEICVIFCGTGAKYGFNPRFDHQDVDQKQHNDYQQHHDQPDKRHKDNQYIHFGYHHGRLTAWVGLRENLQETMVFTIKYRVFL